VAIESSVHLLDVGTQDYGDALVCRVGGRTIMIDGAHPGDERSGQGRAGLIDQLRGIFGHEPPFAPDLLVVTHAHLDHIGALPTMVSSGVLKPVVALVADPDLGWGVSKSSGGGPDAAAAAATASDASRSVVAALREEPLPDDRDDSSLRRWMTDAATLEDRYRAMLARLRADGSTVIRHIRDSHRGLEKDWKDIKLDVLGPTESHALLCAEAIAGSMDAIQDQVRDAMTADAALNPVELYRTLTASRADAADSGSRLGDAVNLLSIVLTFEVDGRRVLLGGDMEFALRSLPDKRLKSRMTYLRRRITKLAPYGFLKLAHHGSDNGVDAALLDAMGPAFDVGIVTGSGSENHPNAAVLGLLGARKDHLHWARTDRNGHSIVDLSQSGAAAFTVGRGGIDDERVGGGDLGVGGSAPPAIASAGTSTITRATTVAAGAVVASTGGPVVVRSGTAGTGAIEISISVPVDVATKITLEISPSASAPQASGAQVTTGDAPRLAGILAVTATERLIENVGADETRRAIAELGGLGAHVLDIGAGLDVNEAVARTRTELAAGQYRGVLLVGGFDVVPSAIVDALPPELRAKMSANDDPDDFTVWADDLYGDIDGDGISELPVSRLPDGRSAALLERALNARPGRRARSAAVRNLARPFADDVFARLPGQRPILISHPTQARSPIYPLDADLIYLMLHGDWEEADAFDGEDPKRQYVRAIDVDDVGPAGDAVVFAGCCWGALTVDAIARDVLDGRRYSPRTPERSMALSFLAQGAQAFVGCTGVHYSPIEPPLFHYGEPMHQYFFEELGDSPAQALFDARARYVLGIPHGPRDLRSQAIEYKIWRQFTCLGVGW
jgi:beta-lactamase superfamily II metal-dependent hydrolase